MPLKPIALRKVKIPVLDIGIVYRADVDDEERKGEKRRVVFGSLSSATEQLREMGYYIRKIDTSRM